MQLTESFVVNNRKQSGELLAEKLRHLKESDALVIAVSHGAAVVGYHLANTLQLPFYVALCNAIPHPADSRKTIGSISADGMLIRDVAHDIPRDYIHRQVVLNQNALRSQQQFYRKSQSQIRVTGKTVILVGDTITSLDSLLASLEYIQRQRPEKVIVTASVITSEVFAALSGMVDDTVCIAIGGDNRAMSFYKTHSNIDEEDVQDLILMSSN